MDPRESFSFCSLGIIFILCFSPLSTWDISPFVFFVKIEPQMSVFAVLFLLLAICICCIKCESVYLLDFSRVQRMLCISHCSINCLFLFLLSRYRLLYVKTGLFSVLSDALLSPMNFFCVFVTMLKKIRERFFFPFFVFLWGILFVLLTLQFLTHVLVYLNFYFANGLAL